MGGLGRVTVVALAAMAAALGACGGGGGEGGDGGGGGSLAGQVVVSGPLRGAAISVDQLRLDSPTGEVRAHVGDTTTDADGRFALAVGPIHGMLRVTARGGAYVDLASGATIELDAGAEVRTLTWLDLFEARADVLVSPIGHLVEARARHRLATLGDIVAAERDAAAHVGAHFGDVDWSHLALASLDAPASSPTAPVRAALVLAALSYLAQDLASAAGASPQVVGVTTLMDQWATDLASPVFDGDDGNDRAPGSGLQLGACPAPPAGCVVPTTGCALGACRTLCDQYAGTPRALLGGAMIKVIASPVNRTGLTTADALAVATAVATNADPDLFGDACVESLDRLPPSLTWTAPSPGEGAYVRGAVALEVTATDDTDPGPRATIDGWPDADGDPTNATALALVDTTTLADGATAIVARAVDLAGNRAAATRTLIVDNLAPAVALDPTGFLVDGATWWTADAAPVLRGAVTETAPYAVKATIAGVDYPGTVAGATFAIPLPAGAVTLSPAPIVVTATDAAGNQGTASQLLRHDATPPALTLAPSTVRDEGDAAGESISFIVDGNGNTDVPLHVHGGALVNLDAPAGSCASVTKFSYLLDELPHAWVRESAPNPLRYDLVASDDGVGIDPARTEFRVGRRDAAGSPTWVVDWTPLAGTATGSTIAYALGLYRAGAPGTTAVPGLQDQDATYDVELRIADRLGRGASFARCLNLAVRPPALHWGTAAVSTGHALALKTKGLGGGLADLLLNASPTGGAIADAPVVNGSDETTYVAASIPSTIALSVSRSFATGNALTGVSTVSINCSGASPPSTCNAPVFVSQPSYASPTVTSAENGALLVRAFAVSAAGVPGAEVACANCVGVPPRPPAGQPYLFALPGRAPGGSLVQPPGRYVLMTMLYQSLNARPSDAASPAAPPFADFTVGGVGMTGLKGVAGTGCTRVTPTGPMLLDYCTQRGTVTPYRTLTSVSISPAATITTAYATAQTATSALTPWGSFKNQQATQLITTPMSTLPPSY